MNSKFWEKLILHFRRYDYKGFARKDAYDVRHLLNTKIFQCGKLNIFNYLMKTN